MSYWGSTLAYAGTSSLTLTNPLNSYKGGTYIEEGTVKVGATNALPTGQNLPAGDVGNTPGLVVFGTLDSSKGTGGILDLAGNNQTVAGLEVEQAAAVANIPTVIQNTVWTFTNNTVNTSSFVTLTGSYVTGTGTNFFTPYNSGLAIGEGITIGGVSGTINFLANEEGAPAAVGSNSTGTLLVGLSFDAPAGSYTISSLTSAVTLTPGSATASSQIIGNSSTISSSTLTFAGGNNTPAGQFYSGEGVSSTSTFGGIIQDSVNSGTQKVALVVSGGTLNLTNNNTYTGGTTVSGANGAVLNVAGLIANDASSGVFLGTTPTFGTHDNIISRAVANGGTYAGLGATDLGGFQTKADLLGGSNTSNGSSLNVSIEMRFENGTDLANLPANAFELSSDILGLTGMVIGGGISGQTDPFALQLSYNPGHVESSLPGSLYLAYTNNAESIPWSNAIGGDFATGIDALTDVQSSYAAFASANNITSLNIANYLGSWGVDTTGDNAWAIVDHNSQFAVVSVPEPATLGLPALSGMALLGRRSRKAK